MLLLLAAKGIGKAGGHYSDWNPARVDEIIFIGQKTHLPRISRAARGSRRPEPVTFRAEGLRRTDGAHWGAAVGVYIEPFREMRPSVGRAPWAGERTGAKCRSQARPHMPDGLPAEPALPSGMRVEHQAVYYPALP